MKKLISVLIIALAMNASAQYSPNVVTLKPLYALYNLNSITDIACSFAEPVRLGGTATTAGSSVTTTSATNTFAPVTVGDILYANTTNNTGLLTNAGQGTITRVVTAKASSASLTVDTAWTLPATGLTLARATPTCGANSGWVNVTGAASFSVNVALDQANTTTGVSFQIQARYGALTSFDNAVNIWPGQTAGGACAGGTYTSGYCVFTNAMVGIGSRFTFTSAGVTFPTYVRLVVKMTSTDDGVDTGVNAEQINASIQVVR